MNYRRVGKSGLLVSEISYGNWMSPRGNTKIYLDAIDLGINTFDTANVYQDGESEILLGKAVRNIERSSIVIMSKCYFPFGSNPNQQGLSRKAIMSAIDGSLRRLNCDYIDVYQTHNVDSTVDKEEIVDTFNLLVDQGKILYWGVSNYSRGQIKALTKLNRIKEKSSQGPISNQIPVNLLNQIQYQRSANRTTANFGIFAYSPLAEGILTGKYASDKVFPTNSRAALKLDKSLTLGAGLNKKNLDSVSLLRKFAEERNVTPTQIAIAYVLKKRMIASVIIGASSKLQLQENVKASQIVLSNNETQELDKFFSKPLDLRALKDKFFYSLS